MGKWKLMIKCLCETIAGLLEMNIRWFLVSILILLFGIQFSSSGSAFANSAEAGRCKFAIDDAYQECRSGKGLCAVN